MFLFKDDFLFWYHNPLSKNSIFYIPRKELRSVEGKGHPFENDMPPYLRRGAHMGFFIKVIQYKI